MKKVILILLCFVLLTGCSSQQKAEPFYENTREDVSFETQYKYYFDDEQDVVCFWYNNSEEFLRFHDTFELHKLGSDGEWYVVGNPEEASFLTEYSHGLEPGQELESRARYEISVYTNKLEKGATYRISTYFFDDEGNHYQVYAEFICDNELAEEEMLELSDGMYGDRHKNPNATEGGVLTPIESLPSQPEQ